MKGMVVTSIVVEAKEKGAALLRGEYQTNCQCSAECILFILNMPEAFSKEMSLSPLELKHIQILQTALRE